MKEKIHIIVSIVISAVLLGLAVSFCITNWMPSKPADWILWGASVLISITAIYRISSLARALGRKEEQE